MRPKTTPNDQNNSCAALTATEQAALVRSGALSSVELVREHLTRIDRLNGAVNAVVTLVPERALAAAEEADRCHAGGEPLPPLHGLPIAHKDLVDTACAPRTARHRSATTCRKSMICSSRGSGPPARS